MSETAGATDAGKKRIASYLRLIIPILIALLVYGSGIIALPLTILSGYRSGNCNTVLTLSNLYTGLYPAVIEDKTVSGPVMECAVYTLAGQFVEEGAWQEALNAYNVYSDTYPGGVYAEEAREQGAGALLGLVRGQVEGGQYAEALTQLRLLVSEYEGTDAAGEGESLFPEIYTRWGASLRESGQFELAQGVLTDFRSWADGAGREDHAKTAQHELAVTYFDWGLDLQSQSDFEGAVAKFDLAASLDAELSAKVEADRTAFHKAWGDTLLDQGEYALAIEHYQLAITTADSVNQPALKDAVTSGFIQWAVGLGASEDFLGALTQLDRAQDSAAGEPMMKSVEEARSDLYLAFSKSEGEQAKQAMDGAFQKLCELGEKPDLPIFGLDEAKIQAGVYGEKIKLPEEIAAMAPGELHFVACIKETEEVIQFVNFYGYLLSRVKVVWDVQLRDVATGGVVAERRFEGSDPAPLPTEPGAIVAGGTVQKYVGNPPEVTDLVNWMTVEMR